MALNFIRQAGASAATLAVCCAALASAPPVHAQDKMTAQTLIDRQLILDQITRYYYNFGKVERQSEESFYVEDGELILGTRHYKGREGIKQAYNRAPAAPAAGAAPAAAAVPPRERMTTQGKEYATWVKANGQWLYKTRQITSGSNPPEGWKD